MSSRGGVFRIMEMNDELNDFQTMAFFQCYNVISRLDVCTGNKKFILYTKEGLQTVPSFTRQVVLTNTS